MREDKDLEFLGSCRDKDLNTLVALLTVDSKGNKSLTENLTSSEKYKKYYPAHSKYWEEIAKEIQLYGGNTIVNTFRGDGVAYREILQDVCDMYKVEYLKTIETKELEQKLLLTILEYSLKELTDEQRKELLEELNLKTTDITAQAITAAVQVAIRSSGFAAYKLSTVIANAVLKSLTGKGLAFVGNQTLMKSVSVLTGPIGWVITGGWTVNELAGPAFRVTVPAVMEVIHLRQKVNTKSYKFKVIWSKILSFFNLGRNV